MRIAINGFGRIGRNFLRTICADKEAQLKLDVCAINIGPGDLHRSAHLFKYDTLLGTYPGTITVENGHYVIDGKSIAVYSECNPELLPWKKYAIDWVVDASGYFTKAKAALGHIKAGARKVLITAPAHGEDITVIRGVNQHQFDATKHTIVSLGSCTTNALLPMLKVLHDNVGIRTACMTSVHAYTNTQVLLDVDSSSDMRRSRSATMNIIPTTTGAAELVERVMPELNGRVSAVSVRVPIAKVSLIDLVIHVDKKITVEKINDLFLQASLGDMHGVIGFTMQPLVSSDYAGDPHSVIIDGLLTSVNGEQVHLFGWYDNEWGYCMRLKDFLLSAV